MAVVSGYIEHIIFRNQDNGYTVLELSSEGDSMTLVGTFSYISEGEYIEAEGELTEHPVYGEQLRVAAYEIKAPEDIDSIERYLGSGVIKGVGPALAARIVKKFKMDTFRIMEEEPERLAEVKGISESKALQIAQQAAEKRELRQAMIFLQQYGISVNLAVKIYQQYGPNLYSVMKTNPYQMADDIPGVGFKIADEIAVKAGIHSDSDFRIKSGLFYVERPCLSAAGGAEKPGRTAAAGGAGFCGAASDGSGDGEKAGGEGCAGGPGHLRLQILLHGAEYGEDAP